MMGTMESVAKLKPKISLCFKDVQNNKHNFTAHKILSIVKLANHLCKMQSFFVKVTNNALTSMELKEVCPVTNMNINKDADDVVSQHYSIHTISS